MDATDDLNNFRGLPPNSFITKLTTKMANVLTKTLASNPTTEPFTVLNGIKLDDTNYGLWFQVIEMYIFGKDKLEYINGDFP